MAAEGISVTIRYVLVAVPVAALMLLGIACQGGDRRGTTAGAKAVSLGEPRADLTAQEVLAFQEGRVLFVDRRPELGPYYFGSTCSECHFDPTLGGGGDIERAAYLGSGPNGGFMYPTHAIAGYTLTPPPAGAIRRIAPPIFGLGLIEQIPDDTIRKTCAKGTGHPEKAKNLGSQPPNKVARFGYKSYLGTLPDFIGDVLRGAMSITNAVEKDPDSDHFADPEVDRAYVESLAAFVRGLAPPPRGGSDPEGEAAFESFGCVGCHVRDMPPALGVYSDFCLHRMGPKLDDGVADHGVLGDEFRTQPLWGLRHRKLLLHDGRATTLEEAIAAHGGTAEASISAYNKAPAEKRAALLRFLATL